MALAICDNCGKHFSKQRKKLENDIHHFCCKPCYNMWRKNHSELFKKKNNSIDIK